MADKLLNYIKLKKVFFIQDISLSDADVENLKAKILNSHALKVKEAGAKTVKLNYYRSSNPFRFMPNLKIVLEEKYHMNKNQVEVTIKFSPIFLFFYGIMLVFFVAQFFLFSPLRENLTMLTMPIIAPFFFYLVLLINFLIYVRVADREIRAVLKNG